jgi:hypothetical protein
MVFIGRYPLGRYDPAFDRWSPVALNPPTTTTSGPLVWSGTEVLEYGVSYPGARYNPTTDSWSVMTTNGAPPPRGYATAVWSGHEMIVWGGQSQVFPQFPITGGRYNPSTDTWTPTRADATTPSGRWLHTAVWTGREMVVWGGQSPDSPYQLNTGGRYDPLADTWAPTSVTVGTPAGREDPSAVWSGTEMIVWGGILGGGGGTRTNTGGGYCACLGPTLTWFRDADGDGHGNAGQSLVSCVPQTGYVTDGTDCDDGNGGAWAAPGEATDLRFTSATDLTWNAPAAPGATALVYDLLRSSDPSDFMAAATCVASGVVGTGAVDPEVPPPGTAYDYLVRAANACPSGEGSLGSRSDGTPRVGRACP